MDGKQAVIGDPYYRWWKLRYIDRYPWNGIKPVLRTEHIKKLKAINKDFHFKWNYYDDCWDIIGYNVYGIPYVIMNLKNQTIDNRVFNRLRWAMWWGRHSIHDESEKLADKAHEVQDKNWADHEDRTYQVMKDVAVPLADLYNAGTGSHTQAVHKWAGYGESELNAK